MEKTITLAQVNTRGIPAPEDDPNTPGSIVEHLSTSMKVTLLRCHIEREGFRINDCELFDVSDYVLDKTKKKLFYAGKRDLGNHFKIRSWQRVKLLVPKSPTELHHSRNVMLTVWPPVFLCDICGRIFKPSPKEIGDIVKSESFPECNTKGCEGEYRQTPHILQCRVCGSVRQLPDNCVKCRQPLFLRKGTETEIETWRLECEGSPRHILDFKDYASEYWCEGEDGLISKEDHELIAKGKAAQRSPMTTVGRGILAPLTSRFPTGDEDPRLSDRDCLLIACQSHLLTMRKLHAVHSAKHRFREGGDLWNREMERLLHAGLPHSRNGIAEAVNEIPADGMEGNPTFGLFQEINGLCKYKVRSHDFSENSDKDALMRRAEDWLTLVSGRTYTSGHSSDLDMLLGERPSLGDSIDRIRQRLSIAQVRYVDKIAIVSGTYGVIRGSVHPIFRGKSFDPVHFPLDRVDYEIDVSRRRLFSKNGRTEFPVIVTKKDTEGLVFSLKAKGIVELIKEKEPNVWEDLTSSDARNLTSYSEEECRAWLMYASFDEKHGEKVTDIARRVVHTISHAIIHRFSRVSGLRDEDLMEMLFPEFAGFVIYSGLGNPLGMLRRVFLDSLARLLDMDIIGEMEECDMDPICANQDEGAACHACLHTPEHVCEAFNDYLDRKILVGEEGYWR